MYSLEAENASRKLFASVDCVSECRVEGPRNFWTQQWNHFCLSSYHIPFYIYSVQGTLVSDCTVRPQCLVIRVNTISVYSVNLIIYITRLFYCFLLYFMLMLFMPVQFPFGAKKKLTCNTIMDITSNISNYQGWRCSIYI